MVAVFDAVLAVLQPGEGCQGCAGGGVLRGTVGNFPSKRRKREVGKREWVGDLDFRQGVRW